LQRIRSGASILVQPPGGYQQRCVEQVARSTR
jgi:hypothetical protein